MSDSSQADHSLWHWLHIRTSSFMTLVKPEAHRSLMETVELPQ